MINAIGSGYSAARLAHLFWEQGAASSNLATPTSRLPVIQRHQIGEILCIVPLSVIQGTAFQACLNLAQSLL